MIICVVRIIYGNHITFSTSTFNIKLLWFTVTYRCYTCCFRWYFTRFLDFFHMSNKFFRPIFEPVRNIFAVFSVCITEWNIFLDIARTYLKQKSKGKYVMNQWILKFDLLLKQVCLLYKVSKRVCKIESGRRFLHMKFWRNCQDLENTMHQDEGLLLFFV